MIEYNSSHRSLAGLVAAAFSFVVVQKLAKTIGDGLPGLKDDLQLREYDRAFNVWLFYKDQLENKDLPVKSMEQRYQQNLKKFRDSQQK
jgi:hypothetical protein